MAGSSPRGLRRLFRVLAKIRPAAPSEGSRDRSCDPPRGLRAAPSLRFLPSSRHHDRASTIREHPKPALFRPQGFSPSRRFAPRCRLRPCFMPQPRPGFSSTWPSGVLLPPGQPHHLSVAVASSPLSLRSAAVDFRRRRHEPELRPRGVAPSGAASTSRPVLPGLVVALPSWPFPLQGFPSRRRPRALSSPGSSRELQIRPPCGTGSCPPEFHATASSARLFPALRPS
jgi:hypothetical protein